MKDELKQEAIKRLEILKLDYKIIKDFKDNNKVYVSKIKETGTEIIFDSKIVDMIKIFEQEKTIKIYHVVIFDSQMYMLAIHKHKEEWKKEKLYLKKGWVTVVLFDTSKEGVIEFIARDVGIEVENGKIKRLVTWKTE